MTYHRTDYPQGTTLDVSPALSRPAGSASGRALVVDNTDQTLTLQFPNGCRVELTHANIAASAALLFVLAGRPWPLVPTLPMRVTPRGPALTPLLARKCLLDALRRNRAGCKTSPVPNGLINDVMELLTHLEGQLAPTA